MNYLHIVVTMRDDDDFKEASDYWAVPECLKNRDDVHIDVTHEEEDEYGLGIPVRIVTINGWVTDMLLGDFRSEWNVDPERAEPAMGFLGDLGDGVPKLYDDERHSFGSEEFNVGGWSPVLDVTVSIIGDKAGMTKNKMRELTAADAGCWIDSHHGQYTIPMMLRIATERGWDGLNETEREYVDRWINSHAGLQDVGDDYIASMQESLIEACNEAEAWLNEHVAPKGLSFGWQDGGFFLMDSSWWEE